MKKSLLILSLLFAAQGAFSGNYAGSGLTVPVEIEQNQVLIDNSKPFLIDMEDGYVFAGSLIKTGLNNYSYMGVVSHGSDIIGFVSGSYQVDIVDGEEVFIESTLMETYSNDETKEIFESRANRDKDVRHNVR